MRSYGLTKRHPTEFGENFCVAVSNFAFIGGNRRAKRCVAAPAPCFFVRKVALWGMRRILQPDEKNLKGDARYDQK